MKIFFYKDKTGRGIKGHFSEEEIREWDQDEMNWDGDSLAEFIESAEKSDEWENASDYYICTKS